MLLLIGFFFSMWEDGVNLDEEQDFSSKVALWLLRVLFRRASSDYLVEGSENLEDGLIPGLLRGFYFWKGLKLSYFFRA